SPLGELSVAKQSEGLYRARVSMFTRRRTKAGSSRNGRHSGRPQGVTGFGRCPVCVLPASSYILGRCLGVSQLWAFIYRLRSLFTSPSVDISSVRPECRRS